MPHDYKAAAAALADCHERVLSEAAAIEDAEKARAEAKAVAEAAVKARRDAEALVEVERAQAAEALEAHLAAVRVEVRSEVAVEVNDLRAQVAHLTATLDAIQNELESERRLHAAAVAQAELANERADKAENVLVLLRESLPVEA